MIGKYSNHSSTDGIIDTTIVLLQLSGPKNTMEMESINESVPQMEPHLKKKEKKGMKLLNIPLKIASLE